ncbi:hypothetical protein [Yoonia sp. 2307UL14-13]|uniref:hypothetical protein n=1 Tax=Yoonia sp. 2307UL14-13 TaxID=3126506 RepID=UPI00309499F5
MALKWVKPDPSRAATFSANDSPYGHFWLDQQNIAAPRNRVDVKQRSVVQVAERLDLRLDDLIKRAFE